MNHDLLRNLIDMPNIDEAIQEIRKKYSHSWMHFIIKGTTETGNGLYRIDDLNEEYFVVRDAVGNGLHIKHEYIHDIRNPRWHRGFYNTYNGAAYLMQIPYRQWRRGLHGDSFVMSDFARSVLHNMDKWFSLALDNQMYYIWDPKFFSYQDIKKEKKNPKYSYAVSKDFAITLGIHKDADYSLFYHTAFVGDIKNDKLTIENPVFKQEFLDSDLHWTKGLIL